MVSVGQIFLTSVLGALCMFGWVGFRDSGIGTTVFRDWGLGFRVSGLGFKTRKVRVQGVGSRI